MCGAPDTKKYLIMVSSGIMSKPHNKQTLSLTKNAGRDVNPLRGFVRYIWTLVVIDKLNATSHSTLTG